MLHCHLMSGHHDPTREGLVRSRFLQMKSQPLPPMLLRNRNTAAKTATYKDSNNALRRQKMNLGREAAILTRRSEWERDDDNKCFFF